MKPRLFDVDPSAFLTFSFLNRYSLHSASTCERQWRSIAIIESIIESAFEPRIIARKLSARNRIIIIVNNKNVHSRIKDKIMGSFNPDQ